MFKFKTSVSLVAIAMALVACGGGGGGSSGTPAVTTPPVVVPPVVIPPVVVSPADLQMTVPAFTYGASSEEFAFVTALNSFRHQIGLGLLAQNTLLDKSATNHLDYVLTNDSRFGGTVDMNSIDPGTGRAMFHIEQGDKPKFTGVQEMDRAKFAGYAGSYVGEQLSFGGNKGGVVALESLVGTVYHRAGLMYQGVRDVGVAVGSDLSQTFTMEMGYQSPQTNAGDFVGIYPTDGQANVGRFTRVEAPNPFPDLSTANADFPTKTGYPITMAVKEGATLEVTSFTVTEAGASVPLETRLMTAANDPNRLLTANVAYLVAKATLKPNTTYTVVFSGKAYNSVLAKTWKFTTGS
jgi:uncharacterized protein YkwD